MIRTVEPDDMATFYDQKDNPVASDMAAFAVRDRPAHEAHWAKILANHAVIARTIVQGDLVVGNIVSFLADGCAKYRLLDRSSVLGPRIRHSGSDRIHRRVTTRPITRSRRRAQRWQHRHRHSIRGTVAKTPLPASTSR